MQLSPQEVESRNLSDDRLEVAARDFQRDGFVVLENALPPDRMQRALALCESTAQRRNRIRCPVPYELLGRWPLKGLVRGGPAWRHLQQLLADEATTRDFCWFRICPPGGMSIERVHRDRVKAADDELPPLSISIDVMLTDFTEQNGATEIWPGSQLTYETNYDQIRRAAEAISKTTPRQITAPAGSIVLRDQRAWHRGGLNTTATSRCMFSAPGWRVKLEALGQGSTIK